jgi:hypothetical protein
MPTAQASAKGVLRDASVMGWHFCLDASRSRRACRKTELPPSHRRGARGNHGSDRARVVAASVSSHASNSRHASVTHLEENLGANDLHLTDDEFEALDSYRLASIHTLRRRRRHRARPLAVPIVARILSLRSPGR